MDLNQQCCRFDTYFGSHTIPLVLKGQRGVGLQRSGECLEVFCTSGPCQATQLTELRGMLFTHEPHA